MKKFFYILVVAVALATSFTACTDENVKPQTNEGGAMGSGIDPKYPA
ncbi:MAG: hypothetical protein WDO14_17355 [Bacteroidota bacterium]